MSCIFWLLIVKQLYGQVSSAASHLPESFQGQLGVMKKFIAIGWIIYPVGFLLALSSNESLREIAYNVADVINKVGFGVACVIAAQMLTKLEAEGSLPTAE